MKKVYIIDSTVKDYDLQDNDYFEYKGVTPYFFETEDEAIKYIMSFEDAKYDQETYEWNYKNTEGCYQEITSSIIGYSPYPKEVR